MTWPLRPQPSSLEAAAQQLDAIRTPHDPAETSLVRQLATALRTGTLAQANDIYHLLAEPTLEQIDQRAPDVVSFLIGR